MSALTTRSVTSNAATTTPIPTVHHARAQLAEVEDLLLSVWTACLPEMETATTARLCSAHRAVHQAMLLLEDDERVVADVGPFPSR
jgi:hypothetical protein